MKLSGISTPALILDQKILQENADQMKRILEGSKLRLRPHYKSHKCASLARWQISCGAIGMTCAKLSEAEDLCDVGIEDILIANQIADPAKIRRAADLAANCRLTVCVDDAANAKMLSDAAVAVGSTIRCLVEYDVGMNRCGVVTKEEVLALAQRILSLPHLELEGLQAYAGHASHMEKREDRERITEENEKKILLLLAYLSQNGVEIKTVSGGSTGTAEIKANRGLYTELQAGSYLFSDATYRTLSLPFQNSLFLLTTVVSQREGLTVVDAGVKTCGIDQGMPSLSEGEAEEIVASEEHFQIHGYNRKTSVGDRLLLIPGHCCSTVNLHDRIYLVDGDRVVDRIPVTARLIGR